MDVSKAEPRTILLLFDPGSEPRARLRALEPHVRVFERKDWEDQPGVLAGIHVIYGYLPDDRWVQARSLQWVQVPWVGVDDVLTPAFRATGVPLYISAGVNARCMVESIFGMVLAHTRGLARMWDAQRRRAWIQDELWAHQWSLEGRTLGLLGVGRIGRLAAGVGRALAMRVIGLSRLGRPQPGVEAMFGPSELEAFCARSDVIVNTLPLTDATRGMLGPAAFAAMKPGTLFVNVGRAQTVQTPALIDALRSGRVGAAMLDVFDREPLPPDDPLWTLPNVYISPHCSGHYPGRMERSGHMFVDNVERWLRGEPLLHPVDPELGY